VKIVRVGVVVAVAALGLAYAALAVAAPPPGLDTSYGQGGTLPVEPPVPSGYQSVYLEDVAVASGGAVYALGSASPCPFPCGGSTLFLYRYLPTGAVDRSFGGVGAVRLPASAWSRRLGVDGRGRALIVSLAESGLRVSRYTASGRLDAGFGHRGTVSLRGDRTLMRAIAAPNGRILLVGGRGIEGGGGELEQMNAHRVRLIRLLPNGRLDSGFGHGGALQVDLPGGFDAGVSFAASGAILIGGRGCCGDPITVTRISPRGVLDTRFNAIAERSLGRLGDLPTEVGSAAELEAVAPRRDGSVDLLGSDGSGGGFELRLRADGRLARFGDRGLRALPLPVAGAVAGSGGSTFAISSVGEQLTAASLLPSGRLSPAFGGGTPVSIPKASFAGLLTRVGHGRVLVQAFGLQECSDYCPSKPILVRFIEPAGAHGGDRRHR
jgi:hypothetical protein